MVARKVLVDLDMNGNKLLNPDFDDGAIALAKLSTDPLARANHTGSQTASTISDFDTQVRTNRLDQLTAPTGSVSMNSQKITNLATPTSSGDAASKSYVDGLVNGTKWLKPVTCATTANITLSGEQTIDGVTTSASRVLVKNQSTASQNGVYLSAAGSWSRVSDLTTGDNAANASMFIEQGTLYADTQWICTSNSGSAVVGTNDLTFAQFGAGTSYSADGTTLNLSGTTFSVKGGGIDSTQLADASVTEFKLGTGSVTVNKLGPSAVTTSKIADAAVTDAKLASTFCKKYSTSIGNGSSTSYTVTHNLGTLDVVVNVFLNSTGAQEEVSIVHATTNTVTIAFNSAPSSNAYRVVVIG